ncbi:MAG: UDP-N-acetylmuramate dehydrogenase [Alphaproteobacteria bacterium]|nr:UDP-N-acetylmuramate dehydrogenase [Alphaproteobacteria bacterium]
MFEKNVELATYTCFGTGGLADLFVAPKDIDELATILRSKPLDMPITILGGCSNILVSDDGIRGLVILTTGLKKTPQLLKNKIKCIAGFGSIAISNFAADNGLSGLEFLSGIPGTIGGAVYGNAGAYGRAMSDVVESIEIMDYNGNIIVIPSAGLGFAYRTAKIPENSVIISVTLNLAFGDVTDIKNKMQEYREHRFQRQPAGVRTCGSLFKNPPNDFAARLIESAGWKGREVNGAAISDKHANFLVNLGGATARDLLELGNAVHDDVLAKFGIDLEWEIKKIG